MDTVHEILTFLARAWSENNQLSTAPGPRFESDPTKHIIYIPEFFGPNFSADALGLDEGIDRWRWWRYTTFHEALHELLSPPNKTQFSSDVIRGCKLPAGVTRVDAISVAERVTNLVEDHRIEKLGLRTYKGYVGEQEWRNNVAKPYWISDKPDAGIINEVDKILLDFQRSILLGHASSNPMVEEWSAQGRAAESLGDLHFACVRIVQDMLDKIDPSEFPKAELKNLPMLGVFNSDEAATERAKGDTDGDGSGAAGVGSGVSEGVRRELSRILAGKLASDADGPGGVGSENAGNKISGTDMCAVVPPEGAYGWLPGDNDLAVRRLVTLLRKWKVGWVEVFDDRGDDIDPEEYILSQSTDEKHVKYFIDERKTSPKTDVAIVFDMSGSIQSRHLREPYLRAAAIIGHAMSFVGTRFGMYAFSGTNYRGGYSGATLHIVKHPRDRWDGRCLARLASIEANGGTPLDKAFTWMEHLRGEHGFKRLVVVTDGEPDGRDTCRDHAQRMIRGGFSVSVLAYRESASSASTALRKARTMLGYRGRVVAIHSLADLPMSFFELIRA